MKYFSLIFIFLFINIGNTFTQFNPFFQVTINDATCNETDGSINLEATSQTLSIYPLPYYIEVEQVGEADSYFDMENYSLTIDGLSKGKYIVRIWLDYDNGCKYDFQFDINEVENQIIASVDFVCQSVCIDLEFSSETGPYEITWLKKTNSGFAILPGWPKNNLSGHNGQEDLCDINGQGLYKVVIQDALCGYLEKSILVNPCECFNIILTNNTNLSICELDDVYPPVPPFQSCDGSLSIDLTSSIPASVLWSNGSTNKTINNLCSGLYTVTVTTSFCSKTMSYEVCCCNYNSISNNTSQILLCDPSGNIPTFNITLNGQNPSLTGNDGHILLIENGGASTKSYKWQSTNGFSSNNKDISGLQAGTYTVTATDGCSKIIKSITLYNCSDIIISAQSIITNACLSQNNGEIKLVLPSNISVTWQTTPSQTGSNIKNLSPGTYCCELTDNISGCVKQNCYSVEQAPSNFDIETSNISNSCKDHNSGSITLSFQNTKQPYYLYNVFNSVTNENVASGYVQVNNNSEMLSFNLSELSAGSYSGFIFDRCSVNIVNFTIGEYNLSVQANVELGCTNDNSITLTTTGDNPPFNYNWDNGLPPLPFHENLPRKIYNVTVSDSKGCKNFLEITDLKPTVEIVEKIPSCSGLWDGKISIKINNPTNSAVQAFYSFSPCTDCPIFPIVLSNPSENPVNLTLNDLSGLIEYTIGINVGGCFELFNFKVGEEKSSREFNSFENLGEDKIMCIYDEICKDNIWEENISEPATLNEEPGKCEGLPVGFLGLFSACGKNQFFCDSVLVHEKIVGPITLRMGEWIAWITSLQLPIEVSAFPGDLCSYITLCENMPDCFKGATRWNLTGGHMAGFENLENGCIKIFCESNWFFDPAPDYTICGLDFLPSYIPFNSQPTLPEQKCKRTTKKMGEMIHFIDNLAADYGPSFTNSTLYDALLFFKNDSRSNCAQVTFCLCSDNSECDEKFKFVSTDINEVICGPIEPPINTGTIYPLIAATCSKYTDAYENFYYTYCAKNCPNGIIQPSCLYLEQLNFDYKRFNFNRFNDNPKSVIFKSKQVSRFERFAISKLTPYINYSDAIFSNESNEKFYHNVFTEDWKCNFNNKVDFVYQDFRTQNGVLIKKIDTLTYNIYNNLFPNTPINLNYDLIFNFRGNTSSNANTNKPIQLTDHVAFQNNYIISGHAESENFRILLDNTNNIIGRQTISGNNNASSFILGKGFSSYITKNPSTIVKVNNTDIRSSFHDKTSLINVIDDFNGNVVITEHISWENNNNNLLKVEENLETGQDTYIFTGFGGFNFDNTFIPVSNTEMIYIIGYENGVKYWKTIPLNNQIDTKNISIASDENGSIFVGLNFSENLRTQDFNIESKGKFDIAIINYKKDGTFIGLKQFGSQDNEVLKDMYFDKNLLHLGGDIEGNTRFRKIGELTFAKFDTLSSHAFISLTSSIGFTNSVVENRVNYTNSKPSTFSLLPNPASSMVELKLDKPLNQILFVKITSMEGKIVFTTILNQNKFNEERFLLQLNQIPSGVYSVQLSSKNNIIDTKKLIKI